MKPIDLLICGTQKAGTSSLLNYLKEHPEICTNKHGEIGYFIYNEQYEMCYKRIYKRYFSHCGKNQKLVAKSSIVLNSVDAIKRAYEHNPAMHLVVLLRNPIDRAYSMYWFGRRRGYETIKSFEEAIFSSSKRFRDKRVMLDYSYLEGGIYIKHIRNLMKFFPKEQIHIFIFENFIKNPIFVCQEIFKILNVDKTFKPDVTKKYNKAAKTRIEFISKILATENVFRKTIKLLLPFKIRNKLSQMIYKLNEKEFNYPPLDENTRKKILNYYSRYNKELEEFLDIKLDNWK